MDTKTMVEQLNSFLRGELAAIETYRQALSGRSAFSAKTELTECQISHEKRAQALRDKILALGGKPVESSGMWGAFAKAVEGGAVVLGDDMAIKALEAEEDLELKDYRTDIPKLDASTRSFLETVVLPEQEKTHRTMSDLKHRLAGK